jgi:predicted transcriptional regulator
MPDNGSLTIPLDPATEAALDEIAATTKRAKADIAAEALADYVRHASEFEAMVREAREDFAAGRTFTHEEVAASARAIIEAAKARRS